MTLSTPWKAAFRRRLLAWYRRHRRDLPWRGSRDPYRVWISEIMLQQTQVATVKAYFVRFLAALPDVRALAAADEQQVLKLWEGLGYYRRARQLHKAAQIIAAEHAGRFPSDPDAVRRLPGIGRYTAGAILSIAFDARLPILEANTIRLLARLRRLEGDVTKAAAQNLLWETAEQLLPHINTGEFNQALMELGSTVCTPRKPNCRACPALGLCAAQLAGLQESIPPVRRKQLESVNEASVVVGRRGKVLLLRRDDAGRWAGLWDFPRFPLDEPAGPALHDELAGKVHQMTGVVSRPLRHLATIRHGVTRFRITLHCHAARYVRTSRKGRIKPKAELRWVKPAELEALPLSATGRKLSRLLLAERVEWD